MDFLNQAQPPSNDALLDMLLSLIENRGGEMTGEIRDMVGELLIALFTRCSEEAKKSGAERLARLTDIPAKALMTIAAEATDLALAILRTERPFPVHGLAKLAASLSPEGLDVLAGRPDVMEPVTDALIAREEPRCLERALANHQARFSRNGFMNLVEMAKSQDLIKKGLARRADLPDPIVNKLWPILAAHMRADMLMAGVARGFRPGAAALPKAGPMRRFKSVEECLNAVDTGRASLCEVIGELADGGQLSGVGALLAKAAEVPPDVALALLTSGYDRGLLVLARAAAIGEKGLVRLVFMRSTLCPERQANIRAQMQVFSTEDPDEAKAVVQELARRRKPEDKAA